MIEKLEKIRESEMKSHMAIYSETPLFEKGTWLEAPIKTVMEILPFFENEVRLRVLDLGAGIGRNSIPIAQKYNSIDCIVDCVDILEFAIEKLYEYSEKYNVREHINGVVTPLEQFSICPEKYNLIMAVSALEHINSEAAFYEKLKEIKNGICEKGIVCLVVNSEVKETGKLDKKCYQPQFEVNFSTEKMEYVLRDVFCDWKEIKFSISKQQYEVHRESFQVNLETNVVTLVAQKLKNL